MIVLRNSVISFIENPFINSGTYRVLDVVYEEKVIFLFPIDNPGNSAKPKMLDLSDLNCLLEEKYVTQTPYQGPRELLLSDEELSSENKKIRDRNYALIQDLVEDPTFLIKFCSKPRSQIVISHASNLNINPLQVYRALRKYWEFGQIPNALLNFTSLYGSRGKDKSASTKQRGRPINNVVVN